MKFGIMFFSNEADSSSDKYGLMIEAARKADKGGFCAVWTPERHFDGFGSIFPNPSLTSAALALVTTDVQLRAGSLISPLHDSLRIAEDWSVVDNLSRGRAAISFGSGWNVNDFVFYPDRYVNRRSLMMEQIETVRKLWCGGTITRVNSYGREVEIRLRPRPVQDDLPVWITSSGNSMTFAEAGRIGANLLTHMVGHDLAGLAGKIRIYRNARAAAGLDPGAGIVSLMLHTFVSPDADYAKAQAWEPLREYLRAAVSLERTAAAGGGTISGGHRLPDTYEEDDPQLAEELLSITCDRYINTASLIGSRDSCSAILNELSQAGVDEIACLVDYGLPNDEILASLDYLRTW